MNDFTTCPSCGYTDNVNNFVNPWSIDAFNTELECPECGNAHTVMIFP